MYNKLCNKQNGLFSFSGSDLHKGQGSLNEFKKTYKPSLISSIHACFMVTFSFLIFSIFF